MEWHLILSSLVGSPVLKYYLLIWSFGVLALVIAKFICYMHEGTHYEILFKQTTMFESHGFLYLLLVSPLYSPAYILECLLMGFCLIHCYLHSRRSFF